MASTLELLEAATGGPFHYRYGGFVGELKDPADLDFQTVLEALDVGCAPGGPLIEIWKMRALQQAWAAHYDLPDFQSAQRLAYLLDRYRSALVYDLAHWCNADLGELWRARRWRTLLDMIDHLPGWSWYSSAVYNDEDHAKMLAESMKARSDEGDKSDSGPPQHHWTPEVAAITRLIDSVNAVAYITQAAAGGKAPQPKPEPRPSSPLEAALHRTSMARKQASHASLVARLLPHKANRDH